MAETIPEHTDEFHDLMADIDNKLAAEGVSIPGRPMRALDELSRRYSIPFPIAKPIPGAPDELKSSWPVSARAHEWYEKQYGDRLKVDWSPGRMVILIREDMWTLRFPRIYGSARFTVSRTIESDTGPSSKGSVLYNVLDAVEKLPRARILTLPDNELEHVYEKFMLGLQAFALLEGTSDSDLMASARADIAASVDHLLSSRPEYGLSKWSSLQATEKALKAAIRLAGGNPKRSHDLAELSTQAEAAGVVNDWSELLSYIQCSPSIRYGEEACDRDPAIQAHHAALVVIILLHKGGALFRSNLAIQPTP